MTRTLTSRARLRYESTRQYTRGKVQQGKPVVESCQLKQRQHYSLARRGLTEPRQDIGSHLCGIVRLGRIRQRRSRWRRFVLLLSEVDDKPYDREHGQDRLLAREKWVSTPGKP